MADSGELAFTMGFPAMFSISGGTMIVIPGVMGMCVFSPKVNQDTNSNQFSLSVFGVQFAQANQLWLRPLCSDSFCRSLHSECSVTGSGRFLGWK